MAAQIWKNNFDWAFIGPVVASTHVGYENTIGKGILQISDAASSALGTLSGDDWYILTGYKRSGSVESAIEIVKVLGVNEVAYAAAGECRIRVERGAEGTTPQTYVAGDLISMRLTAGGLNALASDAEVSSKQDISEKDASGGYAGLTLLKLNLRNALNTVTSWFTTAATAARTWTMPDKDGTVAMTSDITGGSVAASFSSVQSSGSISATGASSVIGYGTGAGITVTQPTSKTTAVTANRGSGEITMYAADQIQSFAYAAFRLNNSLIDQNTLVSVSLTDTDNFSMYEAWVSTTRSGYCYICVRNNDVVPIAYAVKILFTLSKVATS